MGMAERIKKQRVLMGWTQEELGKRIGLQKSAIAKYENGRVENIKRSVIANMANVLQCSPCYLMGWEESETTEAEAPKIIQYYDQLNTTGKEAATEQVRLLTLDEKYTRPDNVAAIIQEPKPDYLVLKAAHNDAPIDDEELEKMNLDAELLKRLQNKRK